MKQPRLSFVLLSLGAALMAGACSAGSAGGEGGADEDGAGGKGPGATTAVTTGNQGGSASSFGDTTATGTNGCNSGPDEDQDGDGFTFSDGDCNDCDPNVGPNAIEVISEGEGGGGGAMEPADEDCDGMIDNVPEPCDSGIPMVATDPLDAARVIELCKVAANAEDWGVVSAQYVRANGLPAGLTDQWGVYGSWGPNVPARGGENLYVMSSGKARLPADGGCGLQTCIGFDDGIAPPGFPQDNPNCPPSTEINDDVGLDVTIKAPANATGYRFDFNFYSFEYPEWVCDFYNDQFIALVNPAPMGSVLGNISFDSMQNPVSVNFGFFDVCAGCPQGTTALAGTGFDTWNDAGATGWLQTTAPIGGNETFTIRFAIWDTGDEAFDSTVLVDNFAWIANGGTVIVGTEPPQ
ncbi:MAG: hypothetical protein HOV80_12210 [Polyangiaceae bacterium]|nr:hypothetical protein [Polyangiaceae bacterium]